MILSLPLISGKILDNFLNLGMLDVGTLDEPTLDVESPTSSSIKENGSVFQLGNFYHLLKF